MTTPKWVVSECILHGAVDFMLHANADALTIRCLQELEPEENWVNNGGVDYGVQLKAPSLSDITTKVLDAEATYSNWGLFNRFCLANELLDGASAAGLSWRSTNPAANHISLRWPMFN